MDGAWRRPPKSLADYGHTEPRRGAEWWGKSVLLTLPLLQSEPQSGRNPRWPLPQEWICTRSNCVDCQAVFAGKPAPTVGSRCVSSISVGCQAVKGASSLATGPASRRSCVDTYAHHRQASPHLFKCEYIQRWELACLRWRPKGHPTRAARSRKYSTTAPCSPANSIRAPLLSRWNAYIGS